MRKDPQFRSIIGTPFTPRLRLLLGALGIALAIAMYAYYASCQARAGNARFGPGFSKLWDTFRELTTVDPRTERVLLWEDTKSSLAILAQGLGLGVLLSVLAGVSMGVFSTVHAAFSPVVTAIAKVPPLALMGMFFILFGVGDQMKVSLIVVGIAPTLANGIVLCAQAVPKNIIVKAYSLGASTAEVVLKVIVPMIIPQIIAMVRLSVGPAWVYLIAAEYIASSQGLGHQIELSVRMTRMDIIIIYCAWLAILGTLIDYGLAALSRLVAPWAADRKDD